MPGEGAPPGSARTAADSTSAESLFGQEVGEDPQFAPIGQESQRAVGNTAGTDLEGGPVLDQPRDVSADASQACIVALVPELGQGAIADDDGGEGIGRPQAVASGDRHCRHPLGDCERHAPQHRRCHADGGAEANPSLCIRQARCHHCRIEREPSACDERARLRE